jgi:hypothetical protein
MTAWAKLQFQTPEEVDRIVSRPAPCSSEPAFWSRTSRADALSKPEPRSPAGA